MNDPKLSILIPTYNGASLIGPTITSVLAQSFKDYEIIVGDDCSTDDTAEVVKMLPSSSIRYFRNSKNLGYGNNLNACFEKARGEFIFLLGHDDILLKDTLDKTVKAFDLGNDIGVVTRPYYWFYDGVENPVRVVRPFNSKKDSILSVFEGQKVINSIFESAGQLSGLAYRKSCIDIPFHEEIFPAHIYPFASILKKYKIVYLKDYTVAVRIESSMTRHRPQIYDISPTMSWIKMFNTVYAGDECESLRRQCIRYITTNNLVGLAQLKNYASYRILLREIYVLLKYRWQNLFNFRFWIYSMGSMLVPRTLLIRGIDFFKRNIMFKKLKKEADLVLSHLVL